ncbi:MAG TPA: hypothetical protein VGO11_06800 [Chthoniobacteraceae bacterium]|jgi:hypothetical protein|nr:hypothetical protein [Chthoniobacteraceae bacterium]
MLARAFAGERLISRLVGGTPTLYNAAHDVTVEVDGTRLEVKFSSLSEAFRGAKTKRWTWHNPYGISGKKEYDRLILVGEADSRIRALRPGADPYVIFDIPFERVPEILLPGCPIQISTDARTARAPRAKILFQEFLISVKLLEGRYGILINPSGSG